MSNKTHQPASLRIQRLRSRECLVPRFLSFGAEIVVHSATKRLGGHGTTVGGVVVDSGYYDGKKADARFPQLTQTSDGTMAFSFARNFGNLSFAMALRIEVVMEVGDVLNPFAA